MSLDRMEVSPDSHELVRLLRSGHQGRPVVRAVIVAIDGSTRRRVGAAMTIEETGTSGTLGGGAAEERVTSIARRLLVDAERRGAAWTRVLTAIPQGPILGKATGGAIRVLLELLSPDELRVLGDVVSRAGAAAVLAREMRSGGVPLVLDLQSKLDNGVPLPIQAACKQLIAAPDMPLAVSDGRPSDSGWLVERLGPARSRFHIHGTGDVAVALARVLEGTPFLPLRRDPSEALDNRVVADDGAYHAVLTGSHETDLEICRQLLTANRFAYLGMIGSLAKRAGVIARLVAGGVAPEAAQRIACPIGLPQVRGKEPAVIAIAIAAEAMASLRVRPGASARE